ncbi:hypothetical protein ABE28_014035 [Peribacillus muralis]|uniref:DUF2515 domain-containing protein n=1 Tax=Peribacillus muralis TaxID=264697 RepID=A0A1B3XQK1_9BACI|nr:DUF2515 family protein [Peribacillus muralis]AOH55473.1 hypothetical protein ABE28_014035 [Peribacillus muralis]
MHLSKTEKRLLHSIKVQTARANRDNISRTKAYEQFFKKHPEIQWSFLAGMVSRNAGWNMCDLEGIWFSRMLGLKYRRHLFLTYEEANWRIFQDAYPQLLLYHYSTRNGRPLFHLCRFFFITQFMTKAWNAFWKHGNKEKLVTALIINEQNIIEKPVIKKQSFVFHSLLFFLQDWMHFSTVLFPTCNGKLYGSSVSHFRNIDERIKLGKRLAGLLFSEELFPQFLEFSYRTEPTGARLDYEQYRDEPRFHETPMLRRVYPVISHQAGKTEQWDMFRRVKKDWFIEPEWEEDPQLTEWYDHKQKQLHLAVMVKNWIY